MPKQPKKKRDQPSEKYCHGCKQTLPSEMFSKDKSKRDGLQARCRECQAEWYQQNKDQIAEQQAEYYQQNKDRIAEQQAEYREQNKNQIAEQQAEYREQNKNQKAEYYQQNKDEHLRRVHKRRAKKNAAVPQRWRKDPEHDENLCYWCGVDLTTGEVKKHIEHIMPVSLGGPDDDNNTTWACQKCNNKKKAKHPLVWIASLFPRIRKRMDAGHRVGKIKKSRREIS